MGPKRKAARPVRTLEIDSDSGSDFSPDKESSTSQPETSQLPVRIRTSKRGQPDPDDSISMVDLDSFHQNSDSRSGLGDSLRDRMVFFFSNSETRLVQAVHDRIAWGHIPYAPDSSAFRALDPADGDKPNTFAKLKLIGAPAPPSGAPITFENATLHPGFTRQAARVLLLNLGNPVSKVAWAPHHEGKSQLLAVGVLNDPQTSPLDRDALQPDLSVFSATTELESVFYIYSFDSETEQLEVHATITSKFGPVLSFSWRPVPESKELAVVFQRGQMALLRIDDKGSFAVEDCSFSLPSKITCCAWRSTSQIVVGTVNGELAEFDVCDGPAPSYMFVVSQSPMTTVSSSYPDSSEFVFGSSMDGYSTIVDVRDLSHVRATVSQRARTFYTDSAWSPLTNSFISCDDMWTSRLIPLWHSEVSLVGMNLTRHLSSISALAASPVHPMVLSGGLDGSLNVSNALRRAMVVKRAAKMPNQAVIWTLECSEATSTYRLTETLTSQPFGKPASATEKLGIYPKTCTITSIDWNSSTANGGWYAAGTASGLLRIENLAQ